MPAAAFPSLPLQVLPTARLTLRPYRADDEAAFFALLDQNRERLRAAFPTREATVRNLADARVVLADFGRDWQTQRLFVFGIWHTQGQQYLGDISLKPKGSRTVTAEVSYYLGAEAQGHGYAREALAAAVRFGFECLRATRLEVRCYADNVRSHAVATGAGFRRRPARLWSLRREQPEVYHFVLDSLPDRI